MGWSNVQTTIKVSTGEIYTVFPSAKNQEDTVFPTAKNKFSMFLLILNCSVFFTISHIYCAHLHVSRVVTLHLTTTLMIDVNQFGSLVY